MKIYSFGVEAGKGGGCGGMSWHGTDRKGQRERKGGEGGGEKESVRRGRGKRMED